MFRDVEDAYVQDSFELSEFCWIVHILWWFRGIFKTAIEVLGLLTCARNYPSFANMWTFCDIEDAYIQDSFELSQFR